jgi:hypothetical protein
MNFPSFQSPTMQIRSLALTRRPVYFNVEGGYLEKIEFRSSVHFWPRDAKNIVLFLIEFEETPAPDVLAACKITSSGIGAYVYLNPPSESGEVRQTIVLPPATVKRIGIRTWNYQEPVLLDDLELVASGAEVSSEYSVSQGVFLNDFDDFRAQARPPMLAVSLLTHDAVCNAHCHAICQHWYETMDDVARRSRHADDVGRVNGFFRLDDGGQVPVTVFNGTPAMLRIPASHASYLEKIGDKARNMIRKAQRQGYAYRKVDPDDYLDDVLAIRTSNPERQGKPIPEYYKIRPTRMIDEPFRSGCRLHGEGFFGVFKDDRLVAYTTIFFYGELGQVNHILGHAEHLQEGVMNLLASEMVREVIEHRPWVKAINYLYPHNKQANVGIGLFKRSIGFMPERLVVTQGRQDLGSYFSNPEDEQPSKPAEPPSEKKALRATTSKAVKVAATQDLIHLPPSENRASALDAVLAKLRESHPGINLLRYRNAGALKESDLAAPGTHAIVFDGMPFADFQEFLAAGLKGFRKTVPKESLLVFEFKRVIDPHYVAQKTVFSKLLSWSSKEKNRQINRELMEYYSKRFKSADLSVDDMKTGFKGSDYVVAGLANYESQDQRHGFDSWLILQKIR